MQCTCSLTAGKGVSGRVTGLAAVILFSQPVRAGGDVEGCVDNEVREWVGICDSQTV
jgi:hypothetical protein